MASTSIGFILSFSLAALVGIAWIIRLYFVIATARRRVVLSESSYDETPHTEDKVSVLVAAKDEESNIETCISSLLKQDWPDLEVIAIDDRSEDRTLDILKRLEAEAEGRLRVVSVKSLEPGWFGKSHAMHKGVAVSTGDWLLFTDADCRFLSPRTISLAIMEAQNSEADFLSIVPVLETPTAWERILQPVCALVLILWFLPEKVNDPTKKTAYANGAFMLLRRSCYEEIGGHQAVAADLNEDIRLARITKRVGLKLRVVENDNLYVTRMYATMGQAWHGWSRIFSGSLLTLERLTIATSMLVFFSILPWVALVASAGGWLTAPSETGTLWGWLTLAWATVVVFEQIATWRVFRIMRIAGGWSMFYFPAACVAIGILINAMFQARGAKTMVWRGTSYQGNRLETPREGQTSQEAGTPADTTSTLKGPASNA